MRRCAMVVMGIVWWVAAAAQYKTVHHKDANTIFLELGGQAGYYSFNYQHNFHINKKFDVAAGAYVSPLLPFRAWNESVFNPRMGASVQGIYKIKYHELGLGAGLSLFSSYHNEGLVADREYEVVSMQFTYSYMFSKHLYWGAALTPVVYADGRGAFSFWGGFRVGYRF